MLLLHRGDLNRPTSHRLAFRELGLAIGLRALPIIAGAVNKNRSAFESRPALHQTIDLLLPYYPSATRSSDYGCGMQNISMRAGNPIKTLIK